MAKQLLKDTAAVIAEHVLNSLLPQLNARLDGLQHQINALQHQVSDLRSYNDMQAADLRTHFDAKFERMLEVINELGLRIHSVGAKADAYSDITRDLIRHREDLIERVVKIEKEPKARSRRRAG